VLKYFLNSKNEGARTGMEVCSCFRRERQRQSKSTVFLKFVRILKFVKIREFFKIHKIRFLNLCNGEIIGFSSTKKPRSTHIWFRGDQDRRTDGNEFALGPHLHTSDTFDVCSDRCKRGRVRPRTITDRFACDSIYMETRCAAVVEKNGRELTNMIGADNQTGMHRGRSNSRVTLYDQLSASAHRSVGH